MGVTIMVVDHSHSGNWVEDGSNWLHAASNVSEVPMWSVETMVDNIIVRLRRLAGVRWTYSSAPGASHLSINPGENPRMDWLSILDHGSLLNLQFGTDLVSNSTYQQFEPQLARLTPHFEPGAIVHLLHCYAGRHEGLMRRLARLWRVIVIGPIHEGHWITGGADLNPFDQRGAVYVDRHGTVRRDDANSYEGQAESARSMRYNGRLRP